MYQIFILLIFYFIILYSIIGYGRIYTLINFKYQASPFDGLFGIAILILISYTTNIFFSHNYLHNLLIIGFGFIIFIFDFNKHFKKRILEYRNLSIIFLIIFIGLLMYKNHDDFYYYHFPYTIILTNFEKVFGLGNLNHGFRTPSSIFYLNSLFYLPLIKYFLLNSGAAYIMGFSNFILFEKIKSSLKKKEYDHILFLSLASLIYINSSFSRLAEHGTDRSALILIFLMSLYYLESLKFKNINLNMQHFRNYFSKLAVLFAIIVSLKAFYLIYSVIFLLWFYQIREYLNFRQLSNLIFKSYSSYLFISIFLFTIFTIFSNTGCFIYPASFTCVENLNWSIPLQQIDQMHLWYEQWSKAGAGPNFRVENPEIYINNFNWVDNWIKNYFFTKVSDNLLVIIFVSLAFIFLFSFNLNTKNNTKPNYKLFYSSIILLLLEWFYNHPALRYGGYTLLALTFFIPISIYISKFKFIPKIINKKIYLILILATIIFITKNFIRINKEINQYSYDPFKSAFFYLNKDGFILNDKVKNKYENWNFQNKRYLIITN